MSALLVAVFRDYEVAENTRVELIREGFPTDRVDVTAARAPGRAGLEPAASLHDKLLQYFRSLLTHQEEQMLAERLAKRIEAGDVAITVHPRGEIETADAAAILSRTGCAEIIHHDLEQQAWEHAAARSASPWYDNFFVHSHSRAHCIYCRLFESDSDEEASEA